jgi:N-acetylmuramoyl-L-alanine amidase
MAPPTSLLSAAQFPGADFMNTAVQSPAPNAALPNSAQAPIPEKILTLDETLLRLSAAPNAAGLRWDPFFGTGIFSVAGHQAAFDTGGGGEPGIIILDSRQILSLPAPYLENGALCFPETFVAALKRAFDNSIQEDQNRYRIAAIIVDPGHGGKDSGAVGNHVVNGKALKVVEKDVNLNAAKMLYDRLQAAYPDKRILLTRTGDTFPSLDDRAVFANSVPLKENEAIVFISIHANSSFNKNARGYEVWYLPPGTRRNLIDKDRYSANPEIIPIVNTMMEEEFTTESTMIAGAIEKRLGEAMGRTLPSRGIKAEDWYVVKNSKMPAVLVELAFVSNEADAIIMTDDTLLRKLTDAIYKGITDYVSIFEGSGGFTVNP